MFLMKILSFAFHEQVSGQAFCGSVGEANAFHSNYFFLDSFLEYRLFVKGILF